MMTSATMLAHTISKPSPASACRKSASSTTSPVRAVKRSGPKPFCAAFAAAICSALGSISTPTALAAPSRRALTERMPLPLPRSATRSPPWRSRLERAHAKLRRGMLARAERQAEIEDHGQTALQVVDRHPLWNDEQALTHWQGAVVLFPGIGPVLVRDAVERQRQRAEFTGRIAAGQLREQGAQLCKLSLRSLLRQVQAHLRQVAHPRGKLFIHIIPIGARARRGTGGTVRCHR